MYMPAKPPEPRKLSRSPDTGRVHGAPFKRSGLLSTLTLSIGGLIFKCKLEIERAGDLAPAISNEQAPSVICSRRRHLPRTSTSDGTQASQINRTISGSRLRVPHQHDSASSAIWQSTDPREREAYRPVAFLRTYTAGASLIKAGEQADHVIVILSGWTKIVVDEGGIERVLAERGPGQLVSESEALRVSVIALETVQALMVRTADFAAFIGTRPAALGTAEARNRDQPASSGRSRGILMDKTTAVDRPRGNRYTGRPVSLNGENCTIILSDVAGFGARTRTDGDRRIIREALFNITHAVLQDIPDVWSWDDRGDGVLTVIPPSVPTARILEQVHRELPAALEEHNRSCPEAARMHLRVAISVGPVASDRMGVSGEAIIVTARLVEAPMLKKAMEMSRASLGVITSAFIYETVIRHARGLSDYSEVQVDVKESSMLAWMKLFDAAPSSEINPAVAS